MKVKELLAFLENQDPEGQIILIVEGRRFKPKDHASSKLNFYTEHFDTTIYASEIELCVDCNLNEWEYIYPEDQENGDKICPQCLIKRRKKEGWKWKSGNY